MSWLVLVLLILPYFALASSRVVGTLRRFYDNRLHGALLAALLIIPYVLAAWPLLQANPREFGAGILRIGLYILLPTLLLLFRPANRKPFDWIDLVAILALWFPIEFDWLPNLSIRVASGLSLPVPKLIGVDLAFLLFLVIRPIKGIGYSYHLNIRDITAVLAAFLGFAVVGLPLGFAIHFIQFGLAPVDVKVWLVSFVGIYFLIGIPEELLFRGIIQNLIEQRFGRSRLTLIAASLIFGAAHLDNATAGYALPNFAYMLMATLAGVAYGWTWRRSGKITSAALTHTLVDWLWGVILSG